MSSLGATLSGNRYQVGHFWYYVSQLLYDDSIELVELESETTGVTDDVVCRYSKPRSILGTDLTFQSDYYQIKYHVDQSGALSFSYLVDRNAVSTKKSILERFYDAFQKLADGGSSRLHLVTNWRWDHADPLADVVRRAYFNTRYVKTKEAQEAIAFWIKKLGCERDAFEHFANRLVFRSSFDLIDQREALSDRLARAGLMPIDLSVDHSPYDDLGQRLIEAGKTKFDRPYLQDFVKKQGIYVRDPSTMNSASVLSITSFKDAFEVVTPAVDADVRDFFASKRELKAGFDWTKDVYMSLASALDVRNLKKLQNPIRASLNCHLSIAFASGRLLTHKNGFEVDIGQRVRGATEVWRSRQTKSDPSAKFEAVFDGKHSKSDLVISVSVTRPTHDDVVAAAKATVAEFDLLKLSSPSVGQTSVADGDYAWSLAESFSNLVAAELKKYKTRPRVHLYMAAPSGLAFRMGQDSSMIGPVRLYEFDFEGTLKYRPSVDLP